MLVACIWFPIWATLSSYWLTILVCELFLLLGVLLAGVFLYKLGETFEKLESTYKMKEHVVKMIEEYEEYKLAKIVEQNWNLESLQSIVKLVDLDNYDENWYDKLELEVDLDQEDNDLDYFQEVLRNKLKENLNKW